MTEAEFDKLKFRFIRHKKEDDNYIDTLCNYKSGIEIKVLSYKSNSRTDIFFVYQDKVYKSKAEFLEAYNRINGE